MNWIEWAGVATMVLVSWIGGRYALAGSRTQAKSNLRVAAIQESATSGRLALDLAERSRDRLDMLEDWERSVWQWWNDEHRPRDLALEDLIRDRLSDEDNALVDLPVYTPMPRPERPVRKVPE